MRLAVIQMDPIFLEREANLDKALSLLKDVKDADIAVLPELFTSGYAFESSEEVRSVSEKSCSGPTFSMLTEAACEYDMHIAAGFPEIVGDSLYNSQMLVGPKGQEALYRKVHLFDNEKRFFSSGDSLCVADISGVKIGLMVCFDWFFPEHMRSLALLGADIIAHSANLVMPYCPDAMVTRCLENRVYAITSNRTGEERGLRFIGSSQITGVDGSILHRCSKNSEETMVIEIDPAGARSKKLNPNNDIFEDRRTDVYEL